MYRKHFYKDTAMQDRLIIIERQLAALAEAVEAYTTNQKPDTFDAMEKALADAKKTLEGEP